MKKRTTRIAMALSFAVMMSVGLNSFAATTVQFNAAGFDGHV